MYHEQELIYLYHLGSQTAYELLLKKYQAIIQRHLVFNYIDTAEISIEDYVQIGLIAFNNTLDKYRADMNAKMTTYFSHAIIDAMRTALRYTKLKKHVPYSKLLFLSENRNYHLYGDAFEDQKPTHRPEYQLKLKEEKAYYRSVIHASGSDFEKAVYHYLVCGYSFKEIAKLLNVNIRKVYNAKYRLQKKIAKLK